jgi:hypothetical protein
MAKKISDEDANEVAEIIASEAVEQLKKQNPIKLLKHANISIHTFNQSDNEAQLELINKATAQCKQAYKAEFYNMLKQDAVAFLTTHTQLFSEADLDLEEYLTTD